MRQFSYQLTNYEGIMELTAQIRREAPDPCKALLLIFDGSFDEMRIGIMLGTIRDRLPGLRVIGITDYADDYKRPEQADFHTFFLCSTRIVNTT